MALSLTGPRAFRDLLSATGYRFTVHRLPGVSFTVQSVNVPSLVLTSPGMPTPFINMPFAGDHIDYGELRLTYLVDEQIANYLEVHDWLRALGKPETFDEYAALHLEPGTGVASDCTLVVLDAKKNPAFVVSFREAVPVSLSELVFDSTTQGVPYIPVTATFRFQDFTISAAT